MPVKIITYPGLRKTHYVEHLLTENGIKNYKTLLDNINLSQPGAFAILFISDISFVLVVQYEQPHDNLQLISDSYFPEFFEDPDELDKAPSRTSRDVFRRAISFLLYNSFYSGKSDKLSVRFCTLNLTAKSVLEGYRFTSEGLLRAHFEKALLPGDAFVYSLLRKEFEEFSIATTAVYGGILQVRATDDAVFEVAFIRDPSILKSSYNSYDYAQKTIDQLIEYFNGTLKKFDLEFEIQNSSDFQKKVWAATVRIPYGQTLSYEEVARKIVTPKNKSNPNVLSRAVGTALSRNPIMILIPCHRVIGKDGKLRGFAGGLDLKDFLLTHELTHY